MQVLVEWKLRMSKEKFGFYSVRMLSDEVILGGRKNENLGRPVNRQPGFRARDSFIASPRDLQKIIPKHLRTLPTSF